MKNKVSRSLILLLTLFSVVWGPLASTDFAQAPASAVSTGNEQYAKALAAIEEKAESRRKELGIPGIALVIVKDDQVIYANGYAQPVDGRVDEARTTSPIAGVRRCAARLSACCGRP